MAKRLEFLRTFNFHVKRNVSVHYVKGSVILVPEAHAKEALRCGAAQLATQQRVDRRNGR